MSEHDKYVKRHPTPPISNVWAVFNYGVLLMWTVAWTRRDSIAAAEAHTGKEWSELRTYCEIHKVKVISRSQAKE